MENEKLDLEVLRDSYFSAIINVQDIEEIKSILPVPEFVVFFPLIEGLIEKLKEERENLLNTLKQADSSDMVEYIRDEIRLIDVKLEICDERIKEANKVIEEETLNNKPKNIIFATTASGIYFENDLKAVPEELYEGVIRCLQRLESGEIENNTEKSRKLRHIAKLKDVEEKKEFKIRVFSRNLPQDCVYVIMVRTKKDNYSKLDKEEPIIRKNNTEREYEEIKRKIIDPDFREKLLADNKVVLQKIYEKLEKEKRVQK